MQKYKFSEKYTPLEMCSESELVRLIHDIKTKISWREQVSLDLNGNETPAEGNGVAKHCKSGSPNTRRILRADVGIKARPGETSNMVKQHSGIAIGYRQL